MTSQSRRHDAEPDSAPPPNAGRRGMLRSMGALALLTSACGGGGDDTAAPPAAPPPAPPGTLSCGATAVSDNHGHSLTIPAADVDSTTAKTYNIVGTADHSHTITLSPAQLAQIKAKVAATVSSSVDFAHAHSVTVNCA